MTKTLFEIKENIKRVGERIFNANSFQFQRGFNICFDFFEQELNHSVLYHQSLLFERINELETELKKQNANAENIAKVSHFGVIAIEEEYQKTIAILSENVNKLREEVKSKNIKINLLEGQIKHLDAKLKQREDAQKSKKNNKKYKRLVDFMDYQDLWVRYKEFNGQTVEESILQKPN